MVRKVEKSRRGGQQIKWTEWIKEMPRLFFEEIQIMTMANICAGNRRQICLADT